MESHTSLINLALLETLKGEKNSDEIDLYVPYVALIINEHPSETFQTNDIKDGFKQRFGISPPESALNSILNRTKKKKIITLNNGLFFKNPAKLNEIVSSANLKQVEIEKSLNRILTSFQDYSKTNHNKELTLKETENFLYDFLTEHLSTFIGTIGGKKAFFETKIRNSQFLTASFIKNLYDTGSDILNSLLVVVKGLILSNYLSHANKSTQKKNLNNITLFIDTPIILGLLGYNGTSKQIALKEFTQLATSLDAKIKVFDITLDETQKIFYSWGVDLEKKNYQRFNPKTLELLRAKGIDKARLETSSILLARDLENLGVELVEDFRLKEQFNCDFAALESHLVSKGFTNNLHHDITCVSRVLNLRAGQKATSLNDKLTLFVTLNTKFERIVNSYLINELPKASIPTVISERLLSTILWLKNPTIFKNLPSRILLANAYSSIYADDKFWGSFASKLENLKVRGGINEEDYLLVRWDKTTLDKVHEASIDAGVDFQDQDIFDIIESIKEKHRNEAKSQLEATKAESTKLLANKDTELSKQAVEIDTTNNLIVKLSNRLNVISSKISHAICVSASLLILTPLGYAIASALPKSSFNISKHLTLPAWANDTAVLLLFVFTILSLAVGLTLRGVYKTAHCTTSKYIYKLLTPQD
jgi:hypothetical protein